MRFKKFVLVMLTVVISLCASVIPAMAARTSYVVDIESLEGNEGTSVVKYIDTKFTYCIENERYGNYISLGEVDLSLYGSVVVTYGADASAVFQDEDTGDSAFIAITTNGQVQDEEGNAISTANIIGQVDIEQPAYSWGDDELEIEFESDYKGEVFLALFHVSEGHNCLVSDITFEGKNTQVETPTPSETPESSKAPSEEASAKPSAAPSATSSVSETQPPSDENNEDGSDMTWILIAAGVAVLVIAGVVAAIVIKKKKGA